MFDLEATSGGLSGGDVRGEIIEGNKGPGEGENDPRRLLSIASSKLTCLRISASDSPPQRAKSSTGDSLAGGPGGGDWEGGPCCGKVALPKLLRSAEGGGGGGRSGGGGYQIPPAVEAEEAASTPSARLWGGPVAVPSRG